MVNGTSSGYVIVTAACFLHVKDVELEAVMLGRLSVLVNVIRCIVDEDVQFVCRPPDTQKVVDRLDVVRAVV